MDIALIGLIASIVAFRIIGMTTGREAGKPLDRKRFLVHFVILVLLFGYCIVSGFFDISFGRGRSREQRLAESRQKSAILLQGGRTMEAVTLASEALALAQKQYGADDPRIRPYLSLHATCLLKEKRFDEAEGSARRALDIAVKHHGKDHPEIALEENILGAVHAELGQLDRAEALYRSALAKTERVMGQIPPALPAVLENLAALCDRTGRAEEAQRLRDRAKAFRGSRD